MSINDAGVESRGPADVAKKGAAVLSDQRDQDHELNGSDPHQLHGHALMTPHHDRRQLSSWDASSRREARRIRARSLQAGLIGTVIVLTLAFIAVIIWLASGPPGMVGMPM